MRRVRNALIAGGAAVALAVSSLVAAPAPAGALSTTTWQIANGWTEAPFGSRGVSVALDNGIVSLRGAVSGGLSSFIGQLPEAYRPNSTVRLPVTLCDGEVGRLTIEPTGNVSVSPHPLGSFALAQCLTSFEGVAYARDGVGFTNLGLVNGWVNDSFGGAPAGARVQSGVVYLRGAIVGGAGPVIATLPATMRPPAMVYVPVDLCNGVNGRLAIEPGGVISVSDEFGQASCLTSLEGVSFVRTGTVTPLTPVGGWAAAELGARAPGFRVVAGTVRLVGAMSAATADPGQRLTTLPASVRPTANVWVSAQLCDGARGRVLIQPSGAVDVSPTVTAAARCLTSLEGVSWPLGVFQPLALANGWTGAAADTNDVGGAVINGVVHLKGAVSAGTANPILTLPPSMRPTNTTYVAVDLGGGAPGSVRIANTGLVDVEVASPGSFVTAQAFTALDSVSFAKNGSGFTGLTLENGWTTAAGTAAPAAKVISGMVTLRGAAHNLTTSTAARIATLPVAMRPAADVYLQAAICSGAQGRVIIGTDGRIRVSAANFTGAKCRTSLDGLTFPLGGTLIALGLSNGWTPSPLGTGAPSAVNRSGVVYLSGAVSSGSAAEILTLPVSLRPARKAFVPVNLCNNTKGRLVILPSGVVSVRSATSPLLTDAQCFTSFEGASYVP